MKHLISTSNALPSLVLLHIIILIFQTPTTTRAEESIKNFLGFYQCSDDSSNYTSGSQFESNLVKHLFPTLIANRSTTGFLTTSFGEDPDKVYGLVQCRGDITEEDCQSCLNDSTERIITNCPNKKKAVLRLGKCLIRYSDNRFFNKSNTAFTNWTWGKPIPNSDVFNQQLVGLFTNLTNEASSIPSRFKTGWTTLSDLSKIYGLAQCTEDLSPTNCITCLQNMFDKIPSCCSGAKGVWISGLSCQIWYRDYLFFGLSSPPPSPPPPPPPSQPSPPPVPQQKPGKEPIVVVIFVLAAVLLLLVPLLCVYLVRRRRRKKRETSTAPANITGEESSLQFVESLQYDLVTLVNATSNFSDANKLGQGGFGAVYKGELQDGQHIAVKRLTNNSVQGPQQFKNEVALLHKLQHRNLVKLLGYCLEGGEKILIYEYLPNTSLDKYLFDPLKRVELDWETRYQIIRGIARGLLYLHEDSRLKIIHRDLKAGNILLDREMNAKIADFGTARLFKVDQTTGNTSIIAGTFGYMAPEYALHGLFSVKSDVYSFGVLLLEIVSGQNINSWHLSTSPADLLSYAWKHWSEGTSIEFIDKALRDNYSRNEVTRSIHVGLLCVQEDTKVRPTMSSVVNMLDNSFALASPAQPTFFTFRSIDPNVVRREIESNDPSSTSSFMSFSSNGTSLQEAWKHWSEGTSIEFIDKALRDNYSRNEATRSIHVGLLCVQEDTKVRPTMSSVVNMLDNSFALASPAQPTFFISRSIDPNVVRREIESDDPSLSKSIFKSFSSKGTSLGEIHPDC